jgi:formylglycine-generating enzyme required for sulfatase activity
MNDDLQRFRQRVEALCDAVGEVRDRLLNCLDVAPRRPADALGLARGTGEMLAKQMLAAIGIKPPPMLDACLRKLEEPKVMSRGLVPAEIITMLHKIRTLGNKATHDDLRIKVTTDDVASVLGDVLRVTQWYFGEFERGPRVDPVFKVIEPPPVELPLLDSRDGARREQQAWVRRLNVEPAWTNTWGVRFRLVPPGRCSLGAAATDREAHANEKPRRTFTNPNPFWVATFPLTNGLIHRLVDEGLAEDDPELLQRLRNPLCAASCRRGDGADDAPVVELSCDDALALCAWMGRIDGRRYRLPTESEWEYLARAGAPGRHWWEEHQDPRQCSVCEARGPSPLDDRRANAWGLIDMLGNVHEWTASSFGALDGPEPLRQATADEPTRAVRGGCWADRFVDLRLSRRLSKRRDVRDRTTGARLLCEVDVAQP